MDLDCLYKKICALLFVGLLLTQGAFALSGQECLVVCEAGSEWELQNMLEAHTVEQLFKVRDESGRGLLHISLQRGPDHYMKLLDAKWPVEKEKGWTPLHEAALLGKADATQKICDLGLSGSVTEPYNLGTPLHIAAFNGHFDVVKVLVEKGAPINARDKDGWTPLSQARDQGFPKIVEWLKKNGAKR